MLKTLLYGILLGIVGYAVYLWKRAMGQAFSKGEAAPPKVHQRYRTRNPREAWIQVYETASEDDAHLIQARLQEEEVECILYEQGKKDIQGNPLKGIGIAVSKSAVPLAQKIISRLPV